MWNSELFLNKELLFQLLSSNDLIIAHNYNKCKVCDNTTKFISITKGYAVHCSTKLERYGDENYTNTEKARITHEENGNWLPKELWSEFKLYSSEVWKHTNRNDLSVLENIERRGNGAENYHLDHRYSIYQGFKDGVLPMIIGSLYNLEMINSRVNMSKNITLEKLYDNSKVV